MFLCVCVCVCVAEFAAELRDFVEQEVRIYWPDLLPLIKMYILEASDRHPPPPSPRREVCCCWCSRPLRGSPLVRVNRGAPRPPYPV